MSRSFRSVLAALAVMVGAPGPLSAEPPSSASWSGLYIGAHAGYASADFDLDPIEPDGFLGGIQAGYNLQLGRVVAGIEGDYSWGAIEDGVSVADPIFGPVNVSVEADEIASIRGRLGLAPYDHLLLYATAGYAWTEATLDVRVAGVGLSSSNANDFDGLVYGGGAEYRLSTSLSARVEGLRYELDGGNSDADIDVVRAGLNFHLPAW